MSVDSVQRIESSAFDGSKNLSFIKLSRNLEYIRGYAFRNCESLSSIFITPSCREIGNHAFLYCKKLIILHIPPHTQLRNGVIRNTALIRASPFETHLGGYSNREEVNQWVKRINEGEDYELHRACSSFNPLKEIIYGIIKRKGPSTFQKKNEIGMTPFDYLDSNPFTEELHIDQIALINQYVLEMMGEAVLNVM